jgi:hypothetical protein
VPIPAVTTSQNSAWQLDGHVAHLTTDALRAEVDVSNPAGGLKILAAQNSVLDGAILFRVGLPHRIRSNAAPERVPRDSVDFLTRCNDLIATYSETAYTPFRAQAYWRYIPPPSHVDGQPAVELILSIQTNLLNSDPTLTVETDLSAARVSRFTDTLSARMIDLSNTATPAVFSHETGSGCFHFQLAHAPLAYTEMVHPTDFHHSTLERVAGQGTSLRLSHRLFWQRLEKGVILRSRIRGLFTPVETDAATIARGYQEFATSGPPLTA